MFSVTLNWIHDMLEESPECNTKSIHTSFSPGNWRFSLKAFLQNLILQTLSCVNKLFLAYNLENF